MPHLVRTIVAGVVFAAAGCGTNQPPEPVPVRGVVRMTEGTLPAGERGMGAPLVPASESDGRCEDHPEEALEPEETGLSMIWSSPASRRLNLVLDHTGAVLRYSDLRGDLSLNDGVEGPRTSIHLDFPARRALLTNRGASGDQEAMRLDFQQALDAPELGQPRQIISDILARCGGMA